MSRSARAGVYVFRSAPAQKARSPLSGDDRHPGLGVVPKGLPHRDNLGLLLRAEGVHSLGSPDGDVGGVAAQFVADVGHAVFLGADGVSSVEPPGLAALT